MEAGAPGNHEGHDNVGHMGHGVRREKEIDDDQNRREQEQGLIEGQAPEISYRVHKQPPVSECRISKTHSKSDTRTSRLVFDAVSRTEGA